MKRTLFAGMMGLMMLAAGCGGGSSPRPAGDVITSITPANGATGVPVTQVLSATFSAELDATTLTAANITLTKGAPIGGTNVPGSIAYDAVTGTLTFTPTLPMLAGTLYTFTIGAGATTKAAGDYAISFTTQVAPLLYGFTNDESTAPFDLWSMNPDGSSPTNLTAFGTKAAGSISYSMAWSPDLTRIAYTASSGDPSDRTNLFVMNADGSNKVNLTNGGANYNVMKLQWAPDGSKIFFQFTPDESASDILYNLASVNPDGTGFLNITNLPSTISLIEAPIWQVSPDGAKLYYCAQGFGPTDPLDLYSINSDGTGGANLTNMAADTGAIYQRLSPDGAKLYFSAGSEAAGLGLYGMNVDGSGRQELVAPVVQRIIISWDVSPDGTQVVALFMDTSTSLGNLFLVKTDGSGTVQLTAGAGSTDGVVGNFSPDGSRIAYLYGDMTAGPVDLYVANADGTGAVNLTNYPAGSWALDQMLYLFGLGAGRWSPDGAQIAFTRKTEVGADDQFNVMMANTDGSGVTALTSSAPPQSAMFGAWW